MVNIAEKIQIEHNPDPAKLKELGVFSWGIWTKEVSTFPWQYDVKETCYLLEGEVIVTPAGGAPIALGKGDLVTFPAQLQCTWDIRQAVKKHYSFD
ncbi:cupin domain-containing protein [[Limnothrix rosea] IAM M-220]|uniref:cupin domain-containing protein n=1 Tax=[Limnothrix rosea] IAM M-220 TaxID=454133 RepID=UPI000964A71A|nr:cupin domain-containing protein [[Limnothrix rosea] IAM M-220]OKH11015.1 cupin [[Limnothrix rosea] IAM M-220]